MWYILCPPNSPSFVLLLLAPRLRRLQMVCKCMRIYTYICVYIYIWIYLLSVSLAIRGLSRRPCWVGKMGWGVVSTDSWYLIPFPWLPCSVALNSIGYRLTICLSITAYRLSFRLRFFSLTITVMRKVTCTVKSCSLVLLLFTVNRISVLSVIGASIAILRYG